MRPLNRNNEIRQDNKYHLDRNENPNAAVIYKELSRILQYDHIYKYPEMPIAYRYMSNIYNARQDQMLLTSGADDAIGQIFRMISDWSSFAPVISIADPTYQMAEVHANMNGMVVRKCPYKRIEQGFACHWNPDGEIIDAFYIANPDNPTGAFVEDLQPFLESGAYVIIDETYLDFSGYESAQYLIKDYENLFVIKTLSKTYGAGAKVGCILSQPQNIEKLNETRLSYEISHLGLAFLEAVMAEKDEHGDEIIRETLYVKRKMDMSLREMGLKLIDTHTNYILVESEDWFVNILNEIAYYKSLNIDNVDYIKLTVLDEMSALNFIDDINKRQ
jgi:histidinol-phosphate aminotransferase